MAEQDLNNDESLNLDAIRQEVQKIKSCLKNWNDTELEEFDEQQKEQQEEEEKSPEEDSEDDDE